MAIGKDTIWERFLAPVIRPFINEEELRRFYESVDWEKEGDRFRQPDLVYPDYYASQNFHGVKGGYLNPGASVSYDPITQYVIAPNETWVRQSLVDAIGGQPRRILDLGCGTGSTTVLLKKAIPEAEVIGLDLSPYMLFMGDRKAQQAQLRIQWRHGNAEHTGFSDASFDVVTASLLFHETPPAVAKAILREAFRLLKAGGQVLILDGNQKTLRQTEWLTDIFEEPYIKAYAAGNIDAWMGAAGFEAVETQDIWWVHQLSRGIKPIPGSEIYNSMASSYQQMVKDPTSDDNELQGVPAPAFSTSP